MYAVLKTGGKQYRVQPGDIIRVEKLDSPLGTILEIKEVLLVGGDTTVIGQPFVEKAKVAVQVVQQAKDRKILIFKKRRRQGYRRMQGHRQAFTDLFIQAIHLGSTVAKAESEAVLVDRPAAREAKRAEANAAVKEAAGTEKKTAKKAVRKKSASSGKKKVSKPAPRKAKKASAGKAKKKTK